MKRRDFIQTVVSVPAGAVLLEQPAAAQLPTPPTQTGGPVPPPSITPPPGTGGSPATQSEVLETVASDTLALNVARFFSDVQFATLRRLADLLMPSLNGTPGALDAQAPQFLDNYVAVSAAERQRLYREGLDDLNRQATARFKKPFAELTTADADAIVRPLFKVRGPLMSVVDLGPFITRVHQDVRTVTINSPQWAAAQAATATLVPRLVYWRKVDPTVPHESLAPWQTKTTRS
jgi:hypothetical protein